MTSTGSISRRIVTLLTVAAILPIFSLTANAQTLKFAWPDGATAKVQTRSKGRRVSKLMGVRNWDMSADFTMRVQKSSDRIVVSREGFSGWKGTIPPTLGGGAERLVDMIPATIVSTEGVFIGIEGHETARKLITTSLEQSEGLDNKVVRDGLQKILSNASLEQMAIDNWNTLVDLWRVIELDPTVAFELRQPYPLPHLGNYQVELTGIARFVKETPCATTEGTCVVFHAETAPDPKQMKQVFLTYLATKGANDVRVIDLDQQFKVDIVLHKTTMLPQTLTITRLQKVEFHAPVNDNPSFSDEVTKSYTFAWVLKPEDKKVSQ